jgi:hypothetical protein
MAFTQHVPSLYVQNTGEDISAKAALSLTKAKTPVIVRLTGGCGLMSREHADAMRSFFEEGFSGFSGALLFGGTQMRMRHDFSEVVHGITEMAPAIRMQCPLSQVLGVVARTSDFQIRDVGLVVSDEPSSQYVTIVHPNQDVCLVVQKSADQETVWEAEYETCAEIVRYLETYAGWRSLLLVYNGGSITEKELLLWAKRKWPVLLIRGSGRTADRYAEDVDFLSCHPSVSTVELSGEAMRERLQTLGVIPAGEGGPKLRLIKTGSD